MSVEFWVYQIRFDSRGVTRDRSCHLFIYFVGYIEAEYFDRLKFTSFGIEIQLAPAISDRSRRFCSQRMGTQGKTASFALCETDKYLRRIIACQK